MALQYSWTRSFSWSVSMASRLSGRILWANASSISNCSLDLLPWPVGSTGASGFFTSGALSGFNIAAAAASSSSTVPWTCCPGRRGQQGHQASSPQELCQGSTSQLQQLPPLPPPPTAAPSSAPSPPSPSYAPPNQKENLKQSVKKWNSEKSANE